MLIIFIKYFVIIFFSFYTYMKLLNFNLRSKPYIQIYLVFSLILSIVVAILRYHFPYINAICLSLSYIVVITLHTKTEVRLSIITGVLSYGISNIVFTVSSLVSTTILFLLGLDFSTDLFPMLLAGFIDSIIHILLFRIRRLKKGMPFLTESAANNIGIIITLLALSCVLILNTNDGVSYIYIIPLAIVIACAILIFIWWNKRITRTYLDRKRESELTELYKTIEEKNKYIEQLKQQNVTLGNLIHKDNKLIPATELAVTDLLINYRDKDPDEIQLTAGNILADLKMKSDSRKNILNSLDMELKQLPRTDLTSIDLLFIELTAKAAKAHVQIDLTLHANIKYLAQNIIAETDLNTLLCELIENAIISAGQNELRKVLITLELVDSIYIINVFDSGNLLAAEVLKNIGINSTATRKDNGGSGTGLVNISEIIKKYEASLIIDELLSLNSIFTKKISVRFDLKNKYVIRSNRPDMSEILSCRNDITVDE